MSAAVSIARAPSERDRPQLRVVRAVHDAKASEESDAGRWTWPSTRYLDDPVGYALDVHGYAPTSRQVDVMQSVRDSDRTAVKAGRKLGKSKTLGLLACWFYSLFEDATVVLCAPSERQIVEVVWREIVALYHDSGRCLACKLRDPDGPRPCPHSTCLDGELSTSVRTGLRAGMRRIIGVAPRNADRARGISGAHQLWLFDESPGVSKEIFDAADGNRAGGAKLVCAGNPTSRTNWFFDCFTRLSFKRITISGLESPNLVFDRKVIPGMADRAWIEEVRDEHGADSPKYQCDVLGEFPTRELLRLITEIEIGEAFDRCDSLADEGELYVGIDPAGGGVGGDESVIILRRGARVLVIAAFVGGTDRIIVELAELLAKHRRRRDEHVHINYDASGGWGADLTHALRALKQRDDFLSFEGLESKGEARLNPALRDSGCARPKDAFWLNMSQRLKTEVGIPYDEDLKEELKFAEWQEDRSEGSRLIEKREFRKRLGRSPDKADALAYCLWEGRVIPLSTAAKRDDLEDDAAPSPATAPAAARGARPAAPRPAMDPYAHGGGIDPYGGRADVEDL